MTNTRQQFSDRGNLSLEEKKFVARVLAIEGKEIWDEQTAAIDKHGLYRAGLMKEGRGFSVKGAGSFYNGNLEVHFVKYLRFHDMRRRNNPKHADSILGVERATRSRRRQYHLYNRIVFGRMNAISNRLMFGFTEKVKQELAQEYDIPA